MSTVSDVRLIVDEVSPVFWPDQQIYDAVNESQVVMQLVPGLDTAEVEITVGAADALVALPAEVMIPLAIRAKADSEPAWITTQAQLEEHSEEWRNGDPGVPRWFVVWDVFNLRPYPRADASYVYVLTYVPYPAVEVADGALSIAATTPDLLAEAIVHLAAAKLMVATMPQFAGVQVANAKELEMRFRRRVRNQQGHRLYRFRPGGKVARAQGGAIRSGQWFV